MQVRGGSGIYVCVSPVTPARSTTFTPPAGPGPFELLRARCLIESEIASVAAVTRKDADLDRIFAALAAMREHMHDKAANEAADRLFHLRIAESTGNSVLLQMVTGLWDHTKAPIWSQMESHFHTPSCAMPRRTITSASSPRCSTTQRRGRARGDARPHRARDRRICPSLALTGPFPGHPPTHGDKR